MEAKRPRPASLEKEEKEEDTINKKEEKQPILKLFIKSGNFSLKDVKFENQLDRKYFRQEVVELSKSLLGKVFVRETPQGIIKAVIVET